VNDFLSSLKADLLDRRLLPFVVIAAAALSGALVYVVLGGGGGSSGETPLPAVPTGGSTGIAVSAAPVSGKAVAETTSGAPKQRSGLSHDPFAPLPGTAAVGTTSTSTSSSKATAPVTSKTETSRSSGGTPPVTTTKEKAPAKPRTEYSVAVLMGTALPGTPPQSAQLTPYEHLKFQQKLPSPELRLITFTGANGGGTSATFKLVGEAILRGPGVCQPSASQCEAIALAVGQTEELEYLPASGPPATYELQVTSITAEKH
jgi:hypothetical protein